MADNHDIALIAHLMRRAGFGEQHAQLEERAAKGYDATVEELLDPYDDQVRQRWQSLSIGADNPTQADPNGLEMDLAERYFIEWNHFTRGIPEYHLFRMINTRCPLEEKMILFWHGILCTSDSKLQNQPASHAELEMFRAYGLGSFKELLLQTSRDPAMVFFLDNCLSHKGAINENYGRELLELFSMGVGMDGNFNYTEDDVKECSRAFTGWTIANSIPGQPYGRYDARFIYNPADHDDGTKTFLGQTGNLGGEDIVDIIAKQPATARFLSRHLYNYFVADDVGVPSWMDTPPEDPETIRMLEDEYFRSNYNIRSMLRVLFHSEAFKNARFRRIKSPAETVIGMMRLIGDWTTPRPGFDSLFNEMKYMGQEFLNPPSVEGWHTGREWIDGGTLVERINFSADLVGDTSYPGVQDIVKALTSEGPIISPEALVDGCLRMLGYYEMAKDTREMLVGRARSRGDLQTNAQDFPQQVGQTLQMIVATREYLYA